MSGKYPALLLIVLLAGRQSFGTPVMAAEPSARPNIVLVLFDDLGWGQPPSYSPESALRTPNLDRLAADGMRFTDAHSAAAVCTPTRYGLLTGRYPSRIGQFGVLTTFSQPIIPTSRLTIASLLKGHGYATAAVGKWHLGLNWVDGRPGTENSVPIGAVFRDGPNALGFDYFCGFTHARNIGTVLVQDRVVAHVEAEDNQPLMLQKALDWMKQQSADRPFFLYFPMCPPHTPIAPSAEFIGKSRAEDVVRNDRRYGDWLFQGDDMLGRILETLDQQKLADNTLVIATSDNGAEGREYAPLRESKRSIYEGGHRVPFVVRWPGRVTAGSVCREPICLNDVIATAADIVGARLPANSAEDSFSLLPLLTSAPPAGPQRGLVHQSSKGDLAVRIGDWKAVFHKDGREELFQLAEDLSETTDLRTGNDERAAKLRSLLQLYIDSGRSSAGESQENDIPLQIPDGTSSEVRGKNSRKRKTKSAM